MEFFVNRLKILERSDIVPIMKMRIDSAVVYDGTGAPPVRGSLVLENGCVAEILPEGAPRPAADRTIDAGGRNLTPAFIDCHGHSDLSLAAAPEGAGKTAQGFAVEISGNCGLSAFPLTERNRPHLQTLWKQYGIELDWSTGREYRARISAAAPALELVSLVGHNTLRAAVAGYGTGPLDAGQRRAECALLRRELAEGAAGLSLGLLYIPGIHADRAELEALFRETAAAGKPVAAHLRSEGNQLTEALAEMFDLARVSGLKQFHISHFKTSGPANWGKLDAAFEQIARARDAGLRVSFDRYPYLESMTQLSVVSPFATDDTALAEQLAAPERFAAFVAALEAAGRDWNAVRLASGPGGFARFSGWKFPEIGRTLGLTPARAAAEILRLDPCGATAAFSGMCAENMRRIFADPWCAVGTDESARPESFRFGSSHPRGFGTVPEFLKLPLPTAEKVRRLTGLPAEIFDLPDATLRPGSRPRRLLLWTQPECAADFVNPHRLCRGFEQRNPNTGEIVR